MEDLKGMARAKRASSKRGRARHSHHKRAHADGSASAAGGVAGDRNAVDEFLPSNWERYSDDGGSEDEGVGPPGADGEVRPKSKGADYSQLLSSDAPKLYEDLPEPEGIFSMLLEPGRGMWNVDSWLEPPSTSEQQTAHDAAALLSLDLGLLGKSLARLHVAERLMVEKELFPKQEAMKQEVAASDSARSSFRTEDRVKEDKADNLAKADSSAQIRSHEITDSSLRINGEYRTDHPDTAWSPVWTSRIKTPGNIPGLKGQAPAVRKDVVGQANRVDDRTTFETSARPSGFRGSVPAAAEADLDELLGMLDGQASQQPLVSSSVRDGAELASSLSLSFLSDQSRGDPQFSKAESLPRELNRTPAYGSRNPHIASTVASTDRSEQIKASSKESNFSAPSLDDDFDSWLDSI